jgi:hypothetical protein
MSLQGNIHTILQQYCEEGEAFLYQIVKGDETWEHHHEPASKHQSMELKFPRIRKFKSAPSARK